MDFIVDSMYIYIQITNGNHIQKLKIKNLRQCLIKQRLTSFERHKYFKNEILELKSIPIRMKIYQGSRDVNWQKKELAKLNTDQQRQCDSNNKEKKE